jgi:hypothetical protein
MNRGRDVPDGVVKHALGVLAAAMPFDPKMTASLFNFQPSWDGEAVEHLVVIVRGKRAAGQLRRSLESVTDMSKASWIARRL